MHDILIVDNDPFDLSVLQKMLDDADYRFVTATSGEETKAIITKHQPQLAAILIDWVLPDTDGVGLLAWLKSRPELSDVEVIVHSVEFDPEHVKRGIDCGAYYYLTKPVEELQLEAIVRAAISSSELKRRLLSERNLDAERRRRLALPKYRDRRVEVSLQRLPNHMELTVKDAGCGFDFDRFMTMDEDRLFDAHGRGVLMASSCLELEYIQPGNDVRVRLPIAEEV